MWIRVFKLFFWFKSFLELAFGSCTNQVSSFFIIFCCSTLPKPLQLFTSFESRFLLFGSLDFTIVTIPSVDAAFEALSHLATTYQVRESTHQYSTQLRVDQVFIK